MTSAATANQCSDAIAEVRQGIGESSNAAFEDLRWRTGHVVDDIKQADKDFRSTREMYDDEEKDPLGIALVAAGGGCL